MTSTAQPGTFQSRNESVNGRSGAAVGFSMAQETSAIADVDPYIADDFLPLNQANSAIIGRLRADEDSPNADLYRRVAASGNSPSPYFYRESSSVSVNSTVSHSHSVPLSPFLARELSGTKLSSLMGLLPEANLAWMSVDEKLFLWSYGNAENRDWNHRSSNGSAIEDFVSFAVPNGQCIVSVGIVRPKKGIFKDVVEWCLVVTTPEEVILCALARESTVDSGIITTHNSSLRLVPTRYIVPTDSVPILSICGTDDGRIFLGGYDGNLYEMSYEGFFQKDGLSTKGYMFDDDTESNGSTDLVTYLASGSKRAVSALLFGTNNTGTNRPRKCRKLNHTASAPSLVSALIPGFVLTMVSTVFGTGSAAGTVAGPIVHLAMDHERNSLYALTSKGFIHHFDLSNIALGGNTTPRLACSIDVTKSARCYLDMIIRGRSMSSSSSYVASISFTGGASGAQNGVGGTDGAREILKMADTEIEKAKFDKAKNRRANNSSSSVAGFYVTSKKEQGTDAILSPVSIHVIPPSESKSLTLLAVTGSGLRYYMSALVPSQSSNSYGNQFRSRDSFHLCHIRALPPFKTSQDGDLTIDYNSSASFNNVSREVTDPKTSGAINPRVQMRGRNGNDRCSVKRSYYKHGFTVMAIDSTSQGTDVPPTGNTIITLTPDCYNDNNSTQFMTYDQQQNANLGGISESLESPLAQNSSQSNDKINAVLPGGIIWDMTQLVSGSVQKFNSISYLQTHSATPTDAELDLEIVPAYFPPSRFRQRSLKTEEKPLRLADSLSIVSHSSQKNAHVGSLSRKNGSIASSALDFLSSLIFNTPLTNPALYSKYTSVTNNGLGKSPIYKISERYGCGPMGFSQQPHTNIGTTANISVPQSRQQSNSSTYFRRNARSSVMSRSPRLSRWLISPPAVPLSESVLKPITSNVTSEEFLALNSGGLHLFKVSSTLNSVTRILSKSNSSNISGDENVKSIFTKYGFDEGCAMCLSVAISGENDAIKRKAVQAALSFAHRPALVQSYGITDANGSAISSSDISGAKQVNHTVQIPRGYSFQSSFLYDGLIALLSRLLRPIWCKPAVVVTEGRTIKSKQYGNTPIILPANVELLLDNATLEEIRRPLVALQNLLRDVFAPAVSVVPGAPKDDFPSGNKMDIDEPSTNGANGGQDLISRALQYQSRTIPRNDVGFQDPTDKDLNYTARLVEDRNVHSVYRLVSRTVQLLTLMSHLHRAHSIPEIPEVEWGLLHGLTYCQLATTRHGQNRIETILTNLVSSNESNIPSDVNSTGISKSSVEANNLSALFASQCYLYFSAGSQLTHLGFRTANSALSYPPSSDERKTLTNKAASYFRIAARNWINPSLIAGRLLPSEQSKSKALTNGSSIQKQWYDELTTRAYAHGSPLARAASILLDLGDVSSIVDLCLICAGNFGTAKLVDFATDDDTLISDVVSSRLVWEKDLYHRQTTKRSNKKGKSAQTNQTNQVGFSLNNQSNSSDLVSGIEVTGKDAQKTCHAVLFHHLFSLLDSSTTSAMHLEAAEQMVAVAASSQNVGFLNMFFKTMLESGYVDTMLRINSPDLESWLKDVEKSPVLLWRHYIIHGLDWKAGEVMWQRARSSVDKKIGLNERMECLTRALNSYTAALENDDRTKNPIGKPGISAPTSSFFRNGTVSQSRRPSSDELNRIVTQISEEIDVATIQRRILSVLESSKSTYQIDDEKFGKLSFSLLNVTDLYNDYAASFALYDICLFILNTCQHNDVATIGTLWRSIICEEIVPCKTRSSEVKDFLDDLKRGSLLEEENIVLIGEETGDAQNDALITFESGEWISRLKNRVLSLGQELLGKGADFTFPLDFITETLEGLHQLHLKHSSDADINIDYLQPSWPLRALMSANVPFPTLLETYQALFDLQQRESTISFKSTKFIYSVSSICCVIFQWLTSAKADAKKGGYESPSSSAIQLRRSSGRVLSLVEVHKSSLESLLNSKDEKVSRIYETFSDLEDAIRKF